jgi:hypothetical protein
MSLLPAQIEPFDAEYEQVRYKSALGCFACKWTLGGDMPDGLTPQAGEFYDLDIAALCDGAWGTEAMYTEATRRTRSVKSKPATNSSATSSPSRQRTNTTTRTSFTYSSARSRSTAVSERPAEDDTDQHAQLLANSRFPWGANAIS